METPFTGIMATDNTPRIRPPAKGKRDVLDVLASSIARTAARENKPEPPPPGLRTTAEPNRELVTEKMLADRWVCSVARLQRWPTVGEGLPFLKVVGKVLYRLKDIEAYEEASLVRKVF